jgi:hypothetical protein
MTTFLTSLMLRYYLVFIGCSLEDEILRIRRKLNHDYETLIPTAYALLPRDRTNEGRQAWLHEKAQVKCLFYPGNEIDPTHSHVDVFLHEVASCADDPVRPVPLDTVDRDFPSVTAERRSIEATRKLLARLKPYDRVASVGEINRLLLRVVYEQPGKSLLQRDLANLAGLDGSTALRPSLTALTPGERVYRMLFLTSIGLVKESNDVDGALRYTLTEGAGEILKVTR